MYRGYVCFWRKALSSPIWMMPPLYHRVWAWIILSVNHEAKTVPTPSGTLELLPGQRMTSLRQIAEGVSWYEYGVMRTPNTKTIKTILDWLESNGQCTVESNAKGTVISVINWSTYNHLDQMKVTQKEQLKVTQSKHGLDTNNNDKNKNLYGDTPYQNILDTYHASCPLLPKVKVMSDSRKAKVALRWKEYKGDFAIFQECFSKAGASSFMSGNNQRGWKADFEWFFDNDKNIAKVLEGKYDDKDLFNTMAGVK